MTDNKLPAVIENKVITIRQELQLADRIASEVLEPGVDYGIIPGTKGYSLLDPGSNTCINAFNCYVRSDVLFRQVDEVMISYVISVELVSRDDNQVKASGVGAASTKETKYGTRWVTDPEAFGYRREDLQKRTRNGEDRYKIVNPEWSELENTILKMARKRAEIDAAQALPGISRFISRLNAAGQQTAGKTEDDPDWSGFWSAAKALGLVAEDVHAILEVNSMKDWIAQGKTLNDAVRTLSDRLAGKRG